MAVFNNNLLAGAGAQSSDSTYKIDQSIRFNASDYPKMTRTPSSAGNRRTFTFSTWIKRGALSTDQVVFGSYINTTNYFLIYFDSTNHSTDNTFRVYEYNGNVLKFWVYGTQKFRDPSAWYHFVVSVDTTNAVSNERIRLYVNGSRITDLTQNQQPSLNYETYINSTNLQTIGEFYGNYYHFDGYMAEMHLLDGYAYDPSFFGEFNDSGIWIPKEYTGSYGTNGFKIDGRDASDLGDDESGQGNDYTTSGLSADDQQPDSPTNNHAVFNPIEAETLITYSNGNLAMAYSGSSGRNAGRSTIQIPANTDAFFEMVMTSNLGSGVDFFIGIEDGTAQSDNSNSIYNNAYIIREDGSFLDQSSRDYSYGTSFTNTDVIGVWRKANGDLVFYKNGTAMNSGTPAKTGLTGTMFFVAGPFNGGSAEARFASSKWTNKPSGVTDSMALNTSNLGS